MSRFTLEKFPEKKLKIGAELYASRRTICQESIGSLIIARLKKLFRVLLVLGTLSSVVNSSSFVSLVHAISS